MDSYDEVHDVKNGRNVETPPELDLSVSSAIKFINNDPEDEEDFDGNEHHLIEDEVIDGNLIKSVLISHYNTVFAFRLE